MPRFLLALPLAVLVVYSVFAAVKYTRMISNIFMGLVYKPSPPNVPSARGEVLTILDTADRQIQALFVDDRAADKLVIFCHESGADKSSWEKYAHFLPERGYRVLSVDFESKNQSGENTLSQWPNTGDVERLLTVTRWAKKACRYSPPVVLFGVSKGANVAFAASFFMKERCVVVADGLFSMKEIFRDYIRKWGPILVKPDLFRGKYPDWVVNIFTELGFWHCQRRSGKKFIDIEGLLRKKHSPLLMIHGSDDDYVPGHHQKFLHNLVSPKKVSRHWVAPGAEHNEAVNVMGREYEKRITDFLKNVSVAMSFLFLLAGAAQAEEVPTRLAQAIGRAMENYDQVRDYRATFQKQERDKDGLGAKETIFLKFEKPFKIFMRWMNTPKKGLQVLYERGKHDNKLVIHKPGVLLGLVPVLFLDQNSPWVREGSASYDIEDAGIGSFLDDLAEVVAKGARENKLKVVTLDTKDGETHDITFPGSEENAGFFAYRITVHFDAETALPDRMRLFDWQDNPMGVYAYEDLKLNVGSQDPEFSKMAQRKLYQLYR